VNGVTTYASLPNWIAIRAVHSQPHEPLGRCHGGEIRTIHAGFQLSGLKRQNHAVGSVDHQRNSAPRVRDLLARERGKRVGKGESEKYQAE
jgi:hypothetical protein